MKNKQLIIAIQAAFLSMAMGNVSAALLTESDIANLTKETIINTAVKDIPTNLTNTFIGKVVNLSVDLNTLPPQLAQFLIDHNESAAPKLSDTQIVTLQQVVDTAVEQAIGKLTETNLDTVTINSDQLVIGDLKISSKELQKFVVQITTFADFSKMNPLVAQFLLDHQADFPSLAQKITALQALLPATTTLSPADAISKLTDWSTVKLDANQNLMIGEVKIPADLISKFIEKVNSLTATELKSLSPDVVKFILAKDDPTSPKLTADQVTALKALLPATTTLTPADAISKLTDWSTVKLDADQNLMIGGVKIPADLIPTLIGKVNSLTATELKSISPDVVKFILAKDDPTSPQLTAAQVTALKALLPATTTFTPADAISKLTDWSTVKLDANQNLMIGEVKIPADLISKFIEKVNSLTATELKSISPDVVKFILAKDDPTSPQLTAAQVTALKALLPTTTTLTPAEAISKLTDWSTVKLDANQNLMIGEVKIPADLISKFIEKVNSLTATELKSISPDVVKFILAKDDPNSPQLTAAQVEILKGIKPVNNLDISSLDAQAVSKLSLEVIASLTPEQVAQFQPAALKGLTKEQAVKLTVAAISGLTKEMVGSLSLEVVAALSNEQLAALSDEAKTGMTSAQVSALGDKAKEIFDEKQLMALFTTKNGQVAICHVPGGNPGKANSIDISPAAVEKHLSHGDSLGPCATAGGKTVAEEEVNVIEIDLSHLTAQQLSELPLETIAQLTATQIALIPTDAMIGMTKEQVGALTEKCVSGLSSEQVLAISSESLAGFNAGNIGGLNQEILLAIGFDLLQLMPAKELKLLSQSNPDVIVLVAINVLETTLPPQVTEEDDHGDNQLPSGLKELLTTIGWQIQSNQLVLSPESISALSTDFLASLSAQQFDYLNSTIMAQLTAEQIGSIKDETLAQSGDEYLNQLPEEKLSELSPEFLTKFVLQLDVKKIEKQFKKNHAKDYAKYLKEFYEKLFKPLGWKVEVKEKDGQFSIKIKPKKEAFKFVSKQFISLIDFEPSENETQADLAEKLTSMPTTSLEGLEDEQIEQIPEQDVEKLPPAAAKPVQDKKTVIQFVEQASTGNVTEDTVNKLTPEVMGNIQPEQVAKFAPVTFKLFTAVQINSLPTVSISVMTAPMVAQLAPAAVSGLKAEQITALPAEAVAGFNAMMIANLQVTAVIGFKHPQLAFLPVEAMEGWKPETFAALDPEEVDGFTVDQMIDMLRTKPEIRQAITNEQWEHLPITPDVPVLQVVEEQPATDTTSGEQPATDATSGEQPATDATSGEQPATDATSGEQPATDTTGGEQPATDTTGGEQPATDTTGGEQPATDTTGGETTPIEATVDEKTGQITLPQAEIDLSKADGITPADLEIKVADLTNPLVIDGKELPPIVEQLEETLADVGMPELTVTQADGIVNITGSGDLAGTDLAFVPDEETIVRVAEGTPAGVTQDENGFYIMVTPNGIKMTFLPAPKDPVQLLKLAHGKQGKGKLKEKKHGAFHFPVEGYGNVAAMFDPMIVPAPVGMLPGISIEGLSGTVVYPDGTMQVMHPAMPEIAPLQAVTKALLGVAINFEYQANGTAKFEFNGQNLQAIPTFKVADDKPSDTSQQPVLEVTNAKEGEQIETLNNQGEPVSQEVVAKATLATEEGTQELNVVKDATTATQAGNGETTTDKTAVPATENTTDTSNTSPATTSSDVTNTTNSDTTGSTIPAVENGSSTTGSGTGGVTNESTGSVPDTTTPTQPTNNAENSTTTVAK